MSRFALLLLLTTLCICLGVAQKASDSNKQTTRQDPKCLLPKEPGPCRMSLDRYYYNPQTKACEVFKFGGCRGNDNRFGHIEACEAACVPNKASGTTTAPVTKAAISTPTPNKAASQAADGATTATAGVVASRGKA